MQGVILRRWCGVWVTQSSFCIEETNQTLHLCLFPHPQGALIPGPPFLFGACIVLFSFLVALFIPECSHGAEKHSNSLSGTVTDTPGRDSDEDMEPLLPSGSAWGLAPFGEPASQCTEL